MSLVTRCEDPEQTGGINLTPLVDMLFLLIIFFIVTSAFVEEEKILEVELAKSRHAEALTAPQSPIVINITKEGDIFLGSRPVSLDELHQRLRDAYTDQKGRQVQIRADQAVAYQHVVGVHGIVNAVGFRRVDYKCLSSER